jgi:hypothetical protein
MKSLRHFMTVIDFASKSQYYCAQSHVASFGIMHYSTQTRQIRSA